MKAQTHAGTATLLLLLGEHVEATLAQTTPPTDLVLAGPESGVLQAVESPFLSPTAGGVRVDLSWGQTWSEAGCKTGAARLLPRFAPPPALALLACTWPAVGLLHPDVAVVLGHTSLRVEEGQA